MASSTEGRKIYKLKKPITIGEQTIEELSFREPLAGDIRRFPLQNQTASDLLDVGAKMCGQPPTVVDKLSIEDVVEIAKLVSDFLPAGLLTGVTG